MTNFSGKPLSSKTANAACGGPQGGGMDSRRNGVAEISPKYLAEVASNAIPSDYKQTEVGVIPEDWEVKTYGEVFTFLSTSTNSRADLSEDGDFGYVHYGDIHTEWNNKLDLNKERLPRISKNIVSSAFVMDGDLIMADASEDYEGIGKTVEVFNVGEKQIVAGLHTFLLRDKEKVLADGFRGYLHSIPAVKSSFDRLATGMKVYGISKNNLSSVCIPVPSLEEQTAIANALSDVDALISELEKLIAKKQAIKTATMQQLLTGRTRLPQFALREDGTPKGTKPSELGEIPEDWEVVTLGTASSFINGRAYSLHEWENSGTPVIRLQNLTGRGDEYYYSNLQLPEKQYCKSGDLLFMWSATFGPVIWRGPKAIYHYHIWKIACEVGYGQSYLFYLLDDMTEKLKRSSSSGGTMLHVTKEKMESTKAAFPSYEEQTAIATILSDMDAEIQALEQRLGKTRQIKQGMMQELLTGKTRLIKPSKEVIHE
jgi:type I restriction enzyme S subunit